MLVLSRSSRNIWIRNSSTKKNKVKIKNWIKYCLKKGKSFYDTLQRNLLTKKNKNKKLTLDFRARRHPTHISLAAPLRLLHSVLLTVHWLTLCIYVEANIPISGPVATHRRNRNTLADNRSPEDPKKCDSFFKSLIHFYWHLRFILAGLN